MEKEGKERKRKGWVGDRRKMLIFGIVFYVCNQESESPGANRAFNIIKKKKLINSCLAVWTHSLLQKQYLIFNLLSLDL
jgi:hypothetical protein